MWFWLFSLGAGYLARHLQNKMQAHIWAYTSHRSTTSTLVQTRSSPTAPTKLSLSFSAFCDDPTAQEKLWSSVLGVVGNYGEEAVPANQHKCLSQPYSIIYPACRDFWPTNAIPFEESIQNSSSHVVMQALGTTSKGCQNLSRSFRGSEGEWLCGFGMGVTFILMIQCVKGERKTMGKLLKESDIDMRKEHTERKPISLPTVESVTFDGAKCTPYSLKSVKTGRCLESPQVNILSSDDTSAESPLTAEHNLQFVDFSQDLDDSRMQRINPEDTASLMFEGLSLDSMHSTDIWGNGQVMIEKDQMYAKSYFLPPLELERRLWKVLQQRQEEQVAELERMLRFTQDKLHRNEEELSWLKACVEELSGLSSNSGVPSSKSTSPESSVYTAKVPMSSRDHDAYHYAVGPPVFDMHSSAESLQECLRNANHYGEYHLGWKPVARTGSSCSFSSEESVISIDVTASIHEGP